MDFRQPSKMARREQRLLQDESPFFSRLGAAIKERDGKKTERIFRRIVQAEDILRRYHERLVAALKTSKQGEAEEIETKIAEFENRLDEILYKKGRNFTVAARNCRWEEVEGMFADMLEAAKGWLALDKELVDFEDNLYSHGGDAARDVYELVRAIQANPHIVRSRRFLRYLAALVKDKRRRRLLRERLSVMFKAGSITAKSALWYFVIWALLWLLRPTYHHQTLQQFERLVADSNAVQTFFDGLPKAKQEELAKAALDENKQVVEEQLDIVLERYAESIFDDFIRRIRSDYRQMAQEVKEKARENPNFDASNVREDMSMEEVEEMVLRLLEKSKQQAVEDIHRNLRDYYMVQVLEGQLPGVLDLAKAVTKGDARSIWEHLKWGAAEPNFKIKIEDQIRRRLNTLLEPRINELKDIMKGKRVWRQMNRTVTTIIEDPSNAEKAITRLIQEVGKWSGTYAAIVLALVCLGAGFLVWGFARIMVINYFRDMLIVIRFHSRRLRERRRKAARKAARLAFRGAKPMRGFMPGIPGRWRR